MRRGVEERREKRRGEREEEKRKEERRGEGNVSNPSEVWEDEILNQCLTAFTLLMHNLTPTNSTGLSRASLGRETRAGGREC